MHQQHQARKNARDLPKDAKIFLSVLIYSHPCQVPAGLTKNTRIQFWTTNLNFHLATFTKQTPPPRTGEKNKRNLKKKNQKTRFKLFCLKETRMRDHEKSFQTHRTMHRVRVYQTFTSTSDRKRNNVFSFL